MLVNFRKLREKRDITSDGPSSKLYPSDLILRQHMRHSAGNNALFEVRTGRCDGAGDPAPRKPADVETHRAGAGSIVFCQ
jgi:hypothetical protein